MNYEAAILYAEQRMREIGKTAEEYHFEPVRISGTTAELNAGKIVLKAYNELYILVNPEIHYGIFILSDNSAFNSENPLDCGVPEFTGLITITKNATAWSLNPKVAATARRTPLEFLRVVIY